MVEYLLIFAILSGGTPVIQTVETASAEHCKVAAQNLIEAGYENVKCIAPAGYDEKVEKLQDEEAERQAKEAEAAE